MQRRCPARGADELDAPAASLFRRCRRDSVQRISALPPRTDLFVRDLSVAEAPEADVGVARCYVMFSQFLIAGDRNFMSSAAPLIPSLTLRAVTTRAVRVPLTFALGTSAAVVTAAPLLLVDVLMEEGIIGHSYAFCYTTSGAKAVAAHLAEAVQLSKGNPARPQSIFKMLSRRFTLLGVTGPVRMALSALDIALWDAAACAAGLPLAELLGAERRPIPAYDSRGLGLM